MEYFAAYVRLRTEILVQETIGEEMHQHFLQGKQPGVGKANRLSDIKVEGDLCKNAIPAAVRCGADTPPPPAEILI